MVRLITCQQAALLVAKRHDHALSQAQRAGLAMHLHYCHHCSRYARQAAPLAQLARHLALGPASSPTRMPLPAQKRRQRQEAFAL